MEQLLTRLGDVTSTSQALHATVESVRDAVGADAAFGYSVSLARISDVSGFTLLQPEQCVRFAQQLLAEAPADRDAYVWLNRTPPQPGVPSTALLATVPRSKACVVAVRFGEGRPFHPADVKAARLAVRMLVHQRTQAQAGTRTLLTGLLHSLAAVIDAKDRCTAGHSERVARIAVLVSDRLGLSAAQRGDLFLAGLLHDVGKIAVRDDILMKPGKLTPEEFEQIKLHPVVGERIVASIKPFERLCPAVRGHHERYAGGGYPDGLAGEAIPLLARILNVADSCDAMMSPRRYRAGLTPKQVDAEIEGGAGRQFDPRIVEAFLAIRGQVYEPIYHVGTGDSVEYAIDQVVESLTGSSMLRLTRFEHPDG